MSAGFAPGQWKLRNATSATVLACRSHTNALGEIVVWDAPVAVAQPWPDDRRLANARLIAAAPDLFYAVNDLLGYLLPRSPTAAAVATTPTPDYAIAKARAALAKARGEQ